MLEVFEEIKSKKFKQAYPILKAACKTYPLLPKLLAIYVKDQDRIITPMKVMKMMRYYQVEKGNDINKLGEIGDFASSRVQLLKKREFGWSNESVHLELTMKDVQFLIDTYGKLKIDVTHKQQYKLMKNCFVLLKPMDVKWFTRMLCRKIEMSKTITEVIKDAKIQNNL